MQPVYGCVCVCSLIEDPNEFSKTRERERERESGFINFVFTESSKEDDNERWGMIVIKKREKKTKWEETTDYQETTLYNYYS